MSCLTRKLQQDLSRYIKKHALNESRENIAQLRERLISNGVCPSDVTTDQLSIIVRMAKA